MQKSTPVIKVDTKDNWKKAKNYIPDVFTIIVMTPNDDDDDPTPILYIGDGKTKVNDLKPLNKKETKELDGNTLVL